MAKVVAVQGKRALIEVNSSKAIIVDMEEKKVIGSRRPESIIARGYWEKPPDGFDEVAALKIATSGVREE